MTLEPHDADPLKEDWKPAFLAAMLLSNKIENDRDDLVVKVGAASLIDLIFESATTYGEAVEMFGNACWELKNSTVCEKPNDLISHLGFPGWQFSNTACYFTFFIGLAESAAIACDTSKMLVFDGHPAIPQAREALLVAQALGELVEIGADK